MPNPMSIVATILIVGLVGIVMTFPWAVGPNGWNTNRRAFYIFAISVGTAFAFMLIEALYSGRFGGPETAAQVAGTVTAAVVAVVGSVGGTIWGTRVGAQATRDSAQRVIDAETAAAAEAEARQMRAVVLMVKLEIDHNLRELRAYWHSITEERGGEIGKKRRSRPRRERDPDTLARNLVRTPMPAWNRQAWEGLIPLIPIALTGPEIEGANHVYAKLQTLESIRSDLARMDEEKGELVADSFVMPGFNPMHTQPPMKFYLHGPELWDKADGLVLGLLESGNPVRRE